MATAEFSNFAGILSAALSQHHLLGFERRGAWDPLSNSRGKRSSIPPHKTRPDSPVPTLQGPCDLSHKTSLNIWKFTVHVLLKPGLQNFEHYFTSMWDECNRAVVWAFFGIAFLRDWNENWPFPVLWPLLSFPTLLAYWVQHFHSIIFQMRLPERVAKSAMFNWKFQGALFSHFIWC